MKTELHVGRFMCWAITALLVIVPMFRYGDDSFVVLPLFFVFLLAVAGMQAACKTRPEVVWVVYQYDSVEETASEPYGVFGDGMKAAEYADELNGTDGNVPGLKTTLRAYRIGEKLA
jgi:hypothetical protein